MTLIEGFSDGFVAGTRSYVTNTQNQTINQINFICLEPHTIPASSVSTVVESQPALSPTSSVIPDPSTDVKDWIPRTSQDLCTLFASLGHDDSYLRPITNNNEQYWRRLRLKSFKIYKQIYKSCVGSRRHELVTSTYLTVIGLPPLCDRRGYFPYYADHC